MEYTLGKLVSEKAKHMKYSKLKSLLQKHPNQFGTYPREMILEIQKKNKNYLEYTLEEKFTKETNSFESCKIRIGYVHNLSNLNEIMNISDFNEDQKLSYLS